MNERERLGRAMQEVWQDGSLWANPAQLGALLQLKLEAMGYTSPPCPAIPPRPVWPGLEGKGLQQSEQVWSDAHRSAMGRGCSPEDAARHAVTVRTAHLFRALVAGLPTLEGFPGDYVQIGVAAIPRRDLAALADPYDGGGK